MLNTQHINSLNNKNNYKGSFHFINQIPVLWQKKRASSRERPDIVVLEVKKKIKHNA